jgi:multiple sugar transport system substrate-binding protein
VELHQRPDRRHQRAQPEPDGRLGLDQWLGSPTSESITGSGGYIWPGIASLDTTFLNYWKAKGVDVSPFLEEAEDSSHVETLP